MDAWVTRALSVCPSSRPASSSGSRTPLCFQRLRLCGSGRAVLPGGADRGVHGCHQEDHQIHDLVLVIFNHYLAFQYFAEEYYLFSETTSSPTTSPRGSAASAPASSSSSPSSRRPSCPAGRRSTEPGGAGGAGQTQTVPGGVPNPPGTSAMASERILPGSYKPGSDRRCWQRQTDARGGFVALHGSPGPRQEDFGSSRARGGSGAAPLPGKAAGG
ncbi:protein TEX261 isoform X3 [Columba livia]|uniref:protein TEX261 isoform X3 n=1 Tax=Columba livia TaxID=8932 RepID=UPI0031BA271F